MPAGFDKGDLIDDAYEVIERIGEGGFGDVYRVRQLSMSRDVALKILLQKGEESEHLAGRFRREVLAVRNLSHPNTVRIFDFSETPEGYLYYTMEYLRGKTLTERIREAGGVPPGEARDVLVQVLKSLSEAHSRGIVHRDLKPGNVMLADVHGETNFVKVLDFGIAKAAHTGSDDLPEDQLTSSENIVGTLRYMAPEQAKDAPIGPYTDLYTLGLVGLELLTGEKVFQGLSNVQILKEQLSPDPLEIPEPLKSSPLGEILSRALAKDIDARFEDADSMRSPLESLTTDDLEKSLTADASTSTDLDLEPPAAEVPETAQDVQPLQPDEDDTETEEAEEVEKADKPDGPPPVPGPDGDEEVAETGDSPDSEELETIPPETGPEDAPAESKATEKVDSQELEELRQNLADGEAPEEVPVREGEGEEASAASNSTPAARASSTDSTTEESVVPGEMEAGDLKEVATAGELTGGDWSTGQKVVAVGAGLLAAVGLFYLLLGGGSESSSDSAGAAGGTDAAAQFAGGGVESDAGMVFGLEEDAGTRKEVRIATPGVEASVFRDGEKLGATPFEIDVDEEIELELRADVGTETVRLTPDSPSVTEVALGEGERAAKGDSGGAFGGDSGTGEEVAGASADASSESGGGAGGTEQRERTGRGTSDRTAGRDPDPEPTPEPRAEPEPTPQPERTRQPEPSPPGGTGSSAPSSDEESSDDKEDEQEDDGVEVPVFN